jgi:sugar (pentulose or hexulose) kinase
VENGELYNKLYTVALSGDSDCGGLLSYNYLSGESVTKMEEGGRPMFIRTPDASFTLSNFMRDKLYSACATLKIGMDILFEKEKVEIDRMFGHGGFFKTKDAGQSVMAAALGCDVAVMETASEGGAWGAAVLANFAAEGKGSLAEYLESNVFASAESSVMTPDEADVEGFKRYMEKYKAGLSVEREAVNNI